MNVILSRYFDGNTKIVANFCKRCYLQEDEVVVTAVNAKFLQNYDPKYYQSFANNTIFIPRLKTEFIEREKIAISSLNLSTPEHKNLMKIKQRINRKYSKLRRKNSQNDSFKVIKNSLKENIKKDEQTDKKINSIKKEIDEESKLNNVGKVEKWIPPISPHNLIEESYYNDPWALLVVTIFLNKTSCFLALPFIEKFFEDFKGPYDVLKVKAESLEPYFVRIGLVKTRATQVWRMSHDFVTKDWVDVGELYGVGKYARDTYRMFHLGDFEVQPSDRYLKIYKAWYLMEKRNDEMGLRESNSQVYLEDYHVVPEDEDRTGDWEIF